MVFHAPQPPQPREELNSDVRVDLTYSTHCIVPQFTQEEQTILLKLNHFFYLKTVLIIRTLLSHLYLIGRKDVYLEILSR